MKTKINVSNYKRVESINLFGVWFNSVYNHNYYYSDLDCELILESCNDDDCYQYYRIEDGHDTNEYLGLTYGVYGIFDEEYEGPKNGTFVTLDSNWC